MLPAPSITLKLFKPKKSHAHPPTSGQQPRACARVHNSMDPQPQLKQGGPVSPKDGGTINPMFHPWETPILFSPLIKNTASGSLGQSFGVLPFGHNPTNHNHTNHNHIHIHNHNHNHNHNHINQDPLHDEDLGASDDFLHFKFDSDGEDEEEEMGQLYNNRFAIRLQQMGYPIGLCYQAVEKFGSNLEACLRWLANPLNSSIDSNNNNTWGNNTLDLLSSWSSSAAHNEDGLKEYEYTHNVKNTTKITPNTPIRTSTGLLGLPLNSSFHFSPSSGINNPSDTNIDPEFYDLSKKVCCYSIMHHKQK